MLSLILLGGIPTHAVNLLLPEATDSMAWQSSTCI